MFQANDHKLFQYLATFSGVFSIISSGINLGWTSPYLPYLLSNSSSIPTTSNEGSWCAVMPLLGAPPGAIIAAFLADRIGRKNTTLLMAPPTIIAFIAIAFADNILLISALRFFIGAIEGGLYTVLPMYIGEISDPDVRGFLSSTPTIAGIFGTLFINILGHETTIFESSLICAVIPLIHFCMFLPMPQSPYFLLKKGKIDEARKSLLLLRGCNNVEPELNNLRKSIEKQEEEKAKCLDLVRVPSNRKACIIFIIICITNKFSGKNPCMFYTSMIFEEAGTTLSSYFSTILYCTVELISTLVAIILVDKFGKKPLLIISTSGCCLSLFCLANYFYIKSFYPDIALKLDWLPLLSLVSYNILFSIGLAFGMVMVLSELFPTNIKATALCLADTFSVSMGAICSKFFQFTKDHWGIYTPFWIFSFCCLSGIYFIIKFVPETNGKTLDEVQQLLIENKKEKKTLEEA